MITELIIQAYLFYVIRWPLKCWFSMLDEVGVFFEHVVRLCCGTHTPCYSKDALGLSPWKNTAGNWKIFFSLLSTVEAEDVWGTINLCCVIHVCGIL
jgi:hypothetical protein